MRRQAGSVRGELHAAVDRALDNGSANALAALAFVAVIREGIETSLFLVGQAAAASADGGAAAVLLGAVIGLAIAGLHRRRLLPGLAPDQPRHLLPLDRRRPRLHRGRAAQPRRP